MWDIIDGLTRGDRAVVEGMAKSRAFWRKFYDDNEGSSVAELADELELAQDKFTRRVFGGARPLAKQAMPVTAIAYLYDGEASGVDRKLARKVIRAFRATTRMSGEVKGSYTDMAERLYGLDKD